MRDFRTKSQWCSLKVNFEMEPKNSMNFMFFFFSRFYYFYASSRIVNLIEPAPMDNFDIGKALYEYRIKNQLSQEDMGKELNKSRDAYRRIETGEIKVTMEDAIKYQIMFDLDGPIPRTIPTPPPPPKKWYQSRYWHWPIPIVIWYLLCDLAITVKFSTYKDGKQIIQDDLPIAGFIIMGLIFCGIYWYLWRPKLVQG